MTTFNHQRIIVPHFGANAHGNPVDDTLVEMGATGWELVTACEGSAQTTLYFKRAQPLEKDYDIHTDRHVMRKKR